MHTREESLEEAIEKVNKDAPKEQQYTLINENDTFEFQCQRCGACCMNREDIIINAWDVFKASKALNIEPKEFVEKYAIQTLGGFSKLPLVTLGHKDDGTCHFLKFDYMDSGMYMCTINDHKPGACASHPLGIVTQYDMKDASSINQFIRVEQCASSKKPVKQNVHDWMRHYLDFKDEFTAAHAFVGMYTRHENFRKWYFMTTLLMAMATKHNKKPEDDPVVQAFALSCDQIIHWTYVNYDITKPFVQQAESNLKELDEFLTKNDDIVHTVEQSINNLLSSGNTTVQEIIDENDADNGMKLDIGKLALLIASRVRFTDDIEGGEE